MKRSLIIGLAIGAFLVIIGFVDMFTPACAPIQRMIYIPNPPPDPWFCYGILKILVIPEFLMLFAVAPIFSWFGLLPTSSATPLLIFVASIVLLVLCGLFGLLIGFLIRKLRYLFSGK
jgi:hypothetical protein